METNKFICNNLYQYRGNSLAGSNLIIENTSPDSIEIFIISSALPAPVFPLPGFRLFPGISFSLPISEQVDVYMRNWFKNNSVNSFGIIYISDFSPISKTASVFIGRVQSAGGTVESVECLNNKLVAYGFL